MNKLLFGYGYLGQRIVALWLEQGHRVYATTRSEAAAQTMRQRGIDPLVCDVLSPQTLKNLPAAESVVHCIALDRSSGQTMRQVYVEGLVNVLANVPTGARFVYVSSTSVYGQVAGEEVDEQAPTEPLEESGKIVLEAEQKLKQTLPDAIVLRFAGIYGPGRLLRRQTLEKNEPIVGDPDKWLNLIHVEDGARAVLAAEFHGTPGRTYNIADDLPVKRRDFYDALARLLIALPPVFRLPTPHRPLPSHDQANRRISNRRMHDELKVKLQYPSYEAGLPASI
jgi:nucleoside-diphosphate-sugar epimerase